MRRTDIWCSNSTSHSFDAAGDRRGARRLGRAGQRDVSLAGEQSRRRIEADPAGARQVDLAPRVEIGEVAVGADWTVERLDVGLELNQIAGHEARGEPEVAQQLHEQPGRVAARARCPRRASLRSPARPGPAGSRSAMSLLQLLVRRHQHVDGPASAPAIDAGEIRQTAASAADDEERLQFVLLPRLVGERKALGGRLEEEVERIVRRPFPRRGRSRPGARRTFSGNVSRAT